LDGKSDCYDSYDEFYNESCQLSKSAYRFQCQSEKKCISWTNVRNGFVNCDDKEDEILLPKSKNSLSFQILCNGFRHLEPVLIEGINETDETNCEEWPCSNIYTRCDHAWTCLNGADERKCEDNWINSIGCPSNHSSCVSPLNLTIICLPLSQFGDTTSDCLGAMDERRYCREKMISMEDANFIYRCWNDTSCTKPVIDSIEKMCDFDRKILKKIPREALLLITTVVTDYLLSRYPSIQYFSLLHSSQYPSSSSIMSIDSSHQIKISSSIENQKPDRDFTIKEAWFCNRGITIRYSSISIGTCLCPPSYYGHRCQYQSQRVSLTLQFQAVCSPECQGLFGIVVSLFDEMEILHSQEILTYIPQHHCDTKFNMNLLYRNSSKNETISYNLRVDAYNKLNNPLTYYASWFLPI
jgi:hypothetical protein